MKKFYEFFEKYLDIKSISQDINNCVIINAAIVNSEERSMEITISSDTLLDRKSIFEVHQTSDHIPVIVFSRESSRSSFPMLS